VTPSPRSGAQLLISTLEELGIGAVFGVPGTQTAGLFEALRRSSIRTVLTTHELGASFAANGYYRASGRIAALVTIPGPGFAYALPGLAEARADSAGLLHLTLRPAPGSQPRFLLQHVDQAAVAAPLVKQVIDVDRAERLGVEVARACAIAVAGEPGPVLVQVAAEALDETTQPSVRTGAPRPQPRPRDVALLDAVAARLAAARRPVILAGQGAFGAAPDLRRLVERGRIPVLTSPSGRGAIPEDHPLALCFEPLRGDVSTVNGVLDAADLIAVVGCKLTHNGTVGFGLRLPRDRLVQVNADPDALGATYPASLLVEASARELLVHLMHARALEGWTASWEPADVRRWRERLQVPGLRDLPEPTLRGVDGGTAAAFFAALRRAMPRDGILVTDSGLHQVLARRHFDVYEPRGLIVPSDFQSMGFGVPAALGAKLAAPTRSVVAVIGDGGLLMAGMELATAAREQIPVVVVVFNDGRLNQIRLHQIATFGHAHATDVAALDLRALAAALGVGYVRLAHDAEATLRSAMASRRPSLVEIGVGDGPGLKIAQVRRVATATARQALGERAVGWLKGVVGRAFR
jgi:acetolactate synthase-1/2/3 large subunit